MYKKNSGMILLILILLFLITGVKMKGFEDEAEALQAVKESELEELISSEDGNNNKTDETDETDIRVLIMGNEYKGEVHREVRISSESRMCLKAGDDQEYIEAGTVLVLKPDDKRFEGGNIRVSSEEKVLIESLERAYGHPAYEGIIELRTSAEGIVVINELPVEKYLKAVVPSEMPASFEMEALKAQAVCARSYAYRQMEAYAYPEYNVHVNDSTDYQVYGNSKLYKSTNRAIKETKGQVVYYQGEIACTYYYSTSCGKTTDIRAWGVKKDSGNEYLKSVKVKGKKGDYEKELPWYRWTAEIPVELLSDLIGLNTGKDIGVLKHIEITKRGGGNVAIEMKVTGEKESVVVTTENKIRAVLGGEGYRITLNDGSAIESKRLLPSAFFTIEKKEEQYIIKGGGFGHGIGMSQNGANEMAKQGADYKEILELFYKDIDIR